VHRMWQGLWWQSRGSIRRSDGGHDRGRQQPSRVGAHKVEKTAVRPGLGARASADALMTAAGTRGINRAAIWDGDAGNG
jgi:NAD(P)H-hydrate repair Nnr-like enzyme with NAD(P)H-hydrate dehydratase domain